MSERVGFTYYEKVLPDGSKINLNPSVLQDKEYIDVLESIKQFNVSTPRRTVENPKTLSFTSKWVERFKLALAALKGELEFD
jgi:hypothetical protein